LLAKFNGQRQANVPKAEDGNGFLRTDHFFG
jgi:hypothetical protein